MDIEFKSAKELYERVVPALRTKKRLLSKTGIKVSEEEIFKYLDGEISLVQAIEEIKTNTHHYAKRQITWFNKLYKNNNANFFSSVTDILP